MTQLRKFVGTEFPKLKSGVGSPTLSSPGFTVLVHFCNSLFYSLLNLSAFYSAIFCHSLSYLYWFYLYSIRLFSVILYSILYWIYLYFSILLFSIILYSISIDSMCILLVYVVSFCILFSIESICILFFCVLSFSILFPSILSLFFSSLLQFVSNKLHLSCVALLPLFPYRI